MKDNIKKKSTKILEDSSEIKNVACLWNKAIFAKYEYELKSFGILHVILSALGIFVDS